MCLKVVTAPERPTLITDTTIIMGSGDADTKDSCPKCGGKVFLVVQCCQGTGHGDTKDACPKCGGKVFLVF